MGMTIQVGKYPQLADEAWLRDQYEVQGKSCPQIASEVGCTTGAVEARCRTFGIVMRGRHYNRWNKKNCERCGEAYTPSGPAQRFCSQKCLHGTAECPECGETFLTKPRGGELSQDYCSRRCWYNSSAFPAGAERLSASGYVMRKVPAGTPGTEGDRRWMKAHRFVVQQSLGRPLRPDETVHHINGDKTDNRLENLQLRQGRHGKGARFVCNDCGSHNVGAVTI